MFDAASIILAAKSFSDKIQDKVKDINETYHTSIYQQLQGYKRQVAELGVTVEHLKTGGNIQVSALTKQIESLKDVNRKLMQKLDHQNTLVDDLTNECAEYARLSQAQQERLLSLAEERNGLDDEICRLREHLDAHTKHQQFTRTFNDNGKVVDPLDAIPAKIRSTKFNISEARLRFGEFQSHDETLCVKDLMYIFAVSNKTIYNLPLKDKRMENGKWVYTKESVSNLIDMISKSLSTSKEDG